MDCVFCKIAAGEIPTDKIYEDEYIIAFNDLDPQAPIHFLVIPKKHITSLATLDESDSDLLAKIMLAIKKLANKNNLEGYRVVTNIGEDGGQTVPHLHFHVLGGRAFHWPPG
ncbi:histidine triad nucleotide-binding protein [uncultured Anaerococcus sp.]|uniref:histidine triad nucleotide-binding protein n=1 Tax=uncultured Anaerococcus sp. TaxID=293428 RepID=UPI0025F2C149|nr:histidine triad nucleotide-binding protein [uncultured Anaerococcus sp.]